MHVPDCVTIAVGQREKHVLEKEITCSSCRGVKGTAEMDANMHARRIFPVEPNTTNPTHGVAQRGAAGCARSRLALPTLFDELPDSLFAGASLVFALCCTISEKCDPNLTSMVARRETGEKQARIRSIPIWWCSLWYELDRRVRHQLSPDFRVSARAAGP